MQLVLSPMNLKKNEELVMLLKLLGSVQSEYPPQLLATRRATFIAQVIQWEKTRSAYQVYSRNEFIQRPYE